MSHFNRKPPTTKLSIRDQKLRTQKSLDHYAALYEKPRVLIDIPPAPAPRANHAPSGHTGIPLEKDIQKAILAALSARTDIVFFGRFNRGAAISQSSTGQNRYTMFNTVPGFPDIHGMLKGGRAFYIEVKRPGGKVSDDQRQFIEKVKRGGGIAGLAYSVDQAQNLLDGKTEGTTEGRK
jgi:hypothetical protein